MTAAKRTRKRTYRVWVLRDIRGWRPHNLIFWTRGQAQAVSSHWYAPTRATLVLSPPRKKGKKG